MDISEESISSVDKEIEITATREELEPRFEEAIKNYRKQINMPGFRQGKVPKSIIRKRFGDEIEQEEINKYIDEVYRNQIAEEYEPVGEPEMLDFSWEDDQLKAKLKIGVKPDVELTEPSEIEVDKMVHDVSDEDVEEELQRTLEYNGTWEEVDGSATEKSKVTADVISLDENDEPVEGEVDEDQELDLRSDENAEFKEYLTGKKAGDEVVAELSGDDENSEEKDKFKLLVKKVDEISLPEMNEEFFKEQSEGEATTEEEYRSYLKSRMQDAYDRRSEEMLKEEVVNRMIENHDLEVPEAFKKQIQDMYLNQLRQQLGGQVPEGFDLEQYRGHMEERAVRDGKWYFISQKLQEHYDDIEIQSDDIDQYIASEAQNQGMSPDELKQQYAQNPQSLEQLRNQIRENKMMDRLAEDVKVNELDRDEYQQKKQKEQEEAEAEQQQDYGDENEKGESEEKGEQDENSSS